jgi:hypothetical protein
MTSSTTTTLVSSKRLPHAEPGGHWEDLTETSLNEHCCWGHEMELIRSAIDTLDESVRVITAA